MIGRVEEKTMQRSVYHDNPVLQDRSTDDTEWTRWKICAKIK